MMIQELQLKNFGKFHDKQIQLSPGINLIYGENEAGKTTLHSFVKGSLYGIRRGRGRAARNDVYSHYEPWENGAYYEGTIRFVCGGKQFRLSRSFAKERVREELVCETDGEILSIPDGDLDVLLGDVSESVFENTVSIDQMKSKTDAGLMNELKEYVVNYQGGGDGALDIQQARLNLRKKKKELAQARDQRLRQEKEKEWEITYRLQYVQEETLELQRSIREEERQLQRQQFGGENPYFEPKKEKKDLMPTRLWCLMAAALFMAMVLVIAFVPHLWVQITTGIISLALLAALYAYSQLHDSKQYPWELVDLVGENQHILWNIDREREMLKEKRIQLDNLQQELLDFRQTQLEAYPEEVQLNAVDLALEHIDQVVMKMRRGLGTQLQQRMSEILSQLTAGKYKNLQVDDQFNLGVHAAQRYVPLEQLSGGTMEQVYFALRMAVGELLCRQEILPVMLDDVFAMYDQDRLDQALSWLAGQNRQVLIFTCHRREGERLEALGLPFNKIVL